ncbi:uncharacterized protein LOC114729107 isoform X2 [Neltuma alba]|uniref:uncharacterized protein LOC114729107 isoform X2 n=1 Tax=Neltuma alba TaxID=207710 RepID=UPI0010A4625A|nr:uncharacterized protein LOC114729107 isoform X2 [Prosopis alba]
MSNLKTLCRPQPLFSFISCRQLFRARASFRSPNCKPRSPSASIYSTWLDPPVSSRIEFGFRGSQRRTVVKASNWTEQKSPYETLVYDGRGTLEEGETAEARFIKIQAAYELLIDDERRRQYDMDNRVNPMKASEAWMEWLMKKRKAFYQRGDMAIAAWAEQQQRELNIRARSLSRSKIDPEEERKILAREKKAYAENFNNTLKRHTLVLKKRDLMRKKAEEERKKTITRLLAEEGLELDSDGDDAL